MGRHTQAAAVNPTASPPQEARTKAEQRCEKVAWKVRRLESQIWKLEWQTRADAATLPAADRLRMKRQIEQLAGDLHERIERELYAIADRL
jgi:hypothetical protein